MNPLHRIILDAWEGQTKLWMVYWIYGVLAGFLLQSLYVAVHDTNVVFIAAVLLIYLAWFIWLAVALWRCADNCDWRGWSLIVRGLVILSLVYTAQAIVMLAI